MNSRVNRFAAASGRMGISVVLALLIVSCGNDARTSMANVEENPEDAVELPKLDGKSGKGLKIESRLTKTQFKIGEPVNIWCTVTNTTDEIKPVGWHSNTGLHFCCVQSDETTWTGVLPLAFPQLDRPVTIKSKASQPGYILFIPPRESITILLTQEANQPYKFRGRIVYDPGSTRDGWMNLEGKEEGPPWKDEWVYSNEFEYEIVADVVKKLDERDPSPESVTTGESSEAAIAELNRDQDVTHYLDKIRAYESLYKHVHVKWRSGAGSELGVQGVTGSGSTELYVDGPRMRKTRSATNINGLHYETVHVSDGKVYKEWMYTDNKHHGQGIVAPAGPTTVGAFEVGVLAPHTSHNFFDFPSISLISAEDQVVKIRYQSHSTLYIDAEYMEWGPYLLVKQYAYFTLENGNVRPGSVYTFEYDLPDPDADVPPKLKRWDQISKTHGVHTVYEIQEVDFDPDVTDDLFTLDFPQGTSVRNKGVGGTRE